MKRIAFVVLLSAGVLARVSAFGAESIDGVYSALPIEASDSGQKTISLAGLLLGSSKFKHVDITGRIEKVAIRADHDALRVVVYDSSGRAVVDDVLSVESRLAKSGTQYIFKRAWKLSGSGETGPAAGETTMTFSIDDRRNLRADTTTIAVGKGLFRSKAATSRHWSLYLRIKEEPNQPPEPTALLVTPRADARVVPSNAVAHL